MSKKEDLVIIGTGGHAKCMVDMIEDEGKYNILGFTVKEKTDETEYFGYPILGTDDLLPDLLKDGVKHAVLGVGGFRNNVLRSKIFDRVKAIGFNLPPVVHPSAVVSKRCEIGEGNIIFTGVVLDVEVSLGSNIVIGTGATISHSSIVGDHSLISAGVTIGGDSEIGSNVLCALGSKIVSGVKVGDNILLAAGAVVVNDILEEGMYVGIPAKLKKQ